MTSAPGGGVQAGASRGGGLREATRRTLGRIEARFGGCLRSPADVLDADPAQFRDAGLSWRKISTPRDLAERLTDGRLDPDELATLADDELIAALTEVPGIGPWTAQGDRCPIGAERRPAARGRGVTRPREG
jgi:hypothetical protein